MFENKNKLEKIYLNYNASKVRWLSDSSITPSDFFCLGSAENLKSVSVWKLDPTQDEFEPILLSDTENLDGFVTELRTKSFEEFFLSTSSGSVYHFKYSHADQRLVELNKWSKLDNLSSINGFDCNNDRDELCFVTENGTINFIRLKSQTNCLSTLDYNELCSLNSVLYLKHFEIAVSDSLGRVKIWDSRSRENKKSCLSLFMEGESSSITCMANDPNKQHIIACGNLNGIIAIYDVRSSKKPFVLSQNHSEPVMEVIFHPFSSDSLFSSSFDGALWSWNTSNRGELKSGWEDRTVNLKNYLDSNRYTLNSFDLNNDKILAISKFALKMCSNL
ncbi:Nucleoporin Nup43 [Brachionus plicatilis]|uniref:Nucleoporin Nup43 n=1 Tax=Brachionus plicatilis TaxID=10195 RepID=A0A3M7QZ56_BRAPC|nr:Nucleoporin Nup43 [Brachionus plicatilis]